LNENSLFRSSHELKTGETGKTYRVYGEGVNTYEILVGNPERKMPFGWCTVEANTEMHFRLVVRIWTGQNSLRAGCFTCGI
jgi:hypothetical protein